MEPPAESSLPATFHEWLDRLARPIEFATKDDCAHAGAVKNLSSFVSSQVQSALAQEWIPPAIESRLRSLRELFIDFQQTLPIGEQQRRLQAACAILGRLREVAPEPMPAHDEPIEDASNRTQDPCEADVWNLPVQFVKGVGPKRMALLQRLGVATVEDALWTIPWRYEDRSVMTPIGNLVPGMVTSICGTIAKCEAKRTRNRRLSVLEVGVEDETGKMQVVFFNQPYLEDVLAVGKVVMMSGRVIAGKQGWMVPRMDVAQYEVVGEAAEAALHVGRIVPIYHETKGWTSRQSRVLVKGLLDEYARELRDDLPVTAAGPPAADSPARGDSGCPFPENRRGCAPA